MTALGDKKATGCAHPDRPAKHICASCGKGICYLCNIDEMLDEKVISETNIEGSTAYGPVYGTRTDTAKMHYAFCAKCYLERISRPDYKLFVGKNRMLEPKKPKFFGMNGLGFFTYCCMWINVPIFGVGLLFFELTFAPVRTAYNDYVKNKQKAERIIKEMEAGHTSTRIIPSETTEEFNYCGECGHQNKAGKKFCKKCGEKLD